MQLIHLKSIDNKKQITEEQTSAKRDEEGFSTKKIENKVIDNNLYNKTKNQLKNTDQIKTNPIKKSLNQKQEVKLGIKNFKELINYADKEREIELKYDLERNVKLVSFKKGKIDISFNEKLNKNFIKTLTEKLLLWTGERWIISLSKNQDAKSIYERNIEKKNEQVNNFEKSKLAEQVIEAFPDAELIDIRDEE